jgi:hypothetical protein
MGVFLLGSSGPGSHFQDAPGWCAVMHLGQDTLERYGHISAWRERGVPSRSFLAKLQPLPDGLILVKSECEILFTL